MESAQGESEENNRTGTSATLRKWGPLGLLVAVAAVIVIVIATSSGGGNDIEDQSTVSDSSSSESADSSSSESAGSSSSESTDSSSDDDTTGTETTEESSVPVEECPTAADARDNLLPEVMFYSEAATRCIVDDIEWGERCDEEIGRLKLPTPLPPECFAPFEGDNGGVTAPGVTEDTINIVYWRWMENDFILNYITGPIANDDTNADAEASLRGMIEYYETYYETYGRSVNLIFYEGTGLISDEVSARADAVKIAEEYDPFMVWNGPTLTNAFENELTSRGIACLSCGPAQQIDYYREVDPLSWAFGMSGDQATILASEYIGKQLAGRNAVYAGDVNYQNRPRVFGRLWIETGEVSADQNIKFEEALAEYNVEITESVAYALDPATLQETAASAIAKFKSAGVTTVLLSGDPISPRDFTREATTQGYYPEWVHISSVLADTNIFARTYDQEQWSNAFGITPLAARVDPTVSGAPFLYKWFFGEAAPADDSLGVIDPWPAVFYPIIQGIGPELTYENWRYALNEADPTRRSLIGSSFSWGEKERWPESLEYDFFGNDEITVFWWDSTKEGIDETDVVGEGMYQFADGGQRYLPGEIPEDDISLFDRTTSIDMYMEWPEGEQPVFYDPLPSSG
jgi:hypothetical protein